MEKRKNIIIALVVAATFIVFYSYIVLLPAGDIPEDGDASIIIHKGESLTSAATKIESKGIIGSKTLLIRLISLIGSAERVKAGKYDFKANRSYLAIAKLLLTGSNSPIKVTFPEGLTYRKMARIVQEELAVDSLEFIRTCENRTILDAFKIKADNLEGYLFPDTYHFYYSAEAPTIVRSMVERFFSVFDDSLRGQAKKLGFDTHKAITMASLIEKETGRVDERRIISAVFHNRLKLGMRLQCDPTVLYALPDLDRSLRYKDLEITSPYNTYRYYGLPPGPIANPGKKSLQAAVNPVDVSYLYFVANGEGGHLFASTNRQHNNNRIKIKRLQRSKNNSG
ncbi:MAG: endolytic transglycosylase MltG [candidate division Zixibacteria bacterium]|nr:endolytic transglycosylase MltG [candidate division Zixibacteria bacterium]